MVRVGLPGTSWDLVQVGFPVFEGGDDDAAFLAYT